MSHDSSPKAEMADPKVLIGCVPGQGHRSCEQRAQERNEDTLSKSMRGGAHPTSPSAAASPSEADTEACIDERTGATAKFALIGSEQVDAG